MSKSASDSLPFKPMVWKRVPRLHSSVMRLRKDLDAIARGKGPITAETLGFTPERLISAANLAGKGELHYAVSPDPHLNSAGNYYHAIETVLDPKPLKMVVIHKKLESFPKVFQRKLLAHEIAHYLHSEMGTNIERTVMLRAETTLLAVNLALALSVTDHIGLHGFWMVVAAQVAIASLSSSMLSQFMEYDADRVSDLLEPNITVGDLLMAMKSGDMENTRAEARFPEASLQERLFSINRSHPLSVDRERMSRRRLLCEDSMPSDRQWVDELIKRLPDNGVLGTVRNEVIRLYQTIPESVR